MKFLCLAAGLAPLLVAIPVDDDAKALPEGPGKEIVIKACIDCHGAGNFRKLRIAEDEWWEKVGDMVDRGAKADEKEQAAIVAYLARNFGKDSKVLMNSAPHSELIVVLGFSADESQAIVTYRTDHGPFKDWREVSKVPGVNPAKVEAKKDKMAF